MQQEKQQKVIGHRSEEMEGLIIACQSASTKPVSFLYYRSWRVLLRPVQQNSTDLSNYDTLLLLPPFNKLGQITGFCLRKN